MKIGILQCDQVREEFQPRFGDYPQMIRALFANIAPHFEFIVYQPQAFDYPKDIDECDAYISTGSRYSVTDNLPWIQCMEAFIRILDQAKKSYVGICFGHQLMIKALGGKVNKSSKGWGIGVTKHQITLKKPWMDPAKPTLNLIASHQDQVVSLPHNLKIEVLAGSAFCPYYMLAYGRHFLSIQGHPEFSKDYSAALIDLRRHIIPTFRVQQGKASLAESLDDQLLAQWLVNFYQSANNSSL